METINEVSDREAPHPSRAREILHDMKRNRASLVSNSSIGRIGHPSSCPRSPSIPTLTEKGITSDTSRARELLVRMKERRESFSNVLCNVSPASEKVSLTPSNTKTASTTELSWVSSSSQDGAEAYSCTDQSESGETFDDSDSEQGGDGSDDSSESSMLSAGTRKRALSEALFDVPHVIIPSALAAVVRGNILSWNNVGISTARKTQLTSSARNLYREESIKSANLMNKDDGDDDDPYDLKSLCSEPAKLATSGCNGSNASVTGTCVSYGSIDRKALIERRNMLTNMLQAVAQLKAQEAASQSIVDARSHEKVRSKELGATGSIRELSSTSRSVLTTESLPMMFLPRSPSSTWDHDGTSRSYSSIRHSQKSPKQKLSASTQKQELNSFSPGARSLPMQLLPKSTMSNREHDGMSRSYSTTRHTYNPAQQNPSASTNMPGEVSRLSLSAPNYFTPKPPRLFISARDANANSSSSSADDRPRIWTLPRPTRKRDARSRSSANLPSRPPLFSHPSQDQSRASAYQRSHEISQPTLEGFDWNAFKARETSRKASGATSGRRVVANVVSRTELESGWFWLKEDNLSKIDPEPVGWSFSEFEWTSCDNTGVSSWGRGDPSSTTTEMYEGRPGSGYQGVPAIRRAANLEETQRENHNRPINVVKDLKAESKVEERFCGGLYHISAQSEKIVYATADTRRVTEPSHDSLRQQGETNIEERFCGGLYHIALMSGMNEV